MIRWAVVRAHRCRIPRPAARRPGRCAGGRRRRHRSTRRWAGCRPHLGDRRRAALLAAPARSTVETW